MPTLSGEYVGIDNGLIWWAIFLPETIINSGNILPTLQGDLWDKQI